MTRLCWDVGMVYGWFMALDPHNWGTCLDPHKMVRHCQDVEHSRAIHCLEVDHLSPLDLAIAQTEVAMNTANLAFLGEETTHLSLLIIWVSGEGVRILKILKILKGNTEGSSTRGFSKISHRSISATFWKLLSGKLRKPFAFSMMLWVFTEDRGVMDVSLGLVTDESDYGQWNSYQLIH